MHCNLNFFLKSDANILRYHFDVAYRKCFLYKLIREENKIFKEIMQFHYMTSIWPRPCTRTPAPGVMKFIILVDSSLVIITTYLDCLIYDWE